MENMLFKYKNEYPPAKGSLLISEPHLPDYNFERSVIFLCEHNEKGSFGLVLNKLSDFTLNQLVDVPLSYKVGLGGPVEPNTLHFLFRNNATIEDSIQVGSQIYWGGNYEQLIAWQTITGASADVLFFMGYSGWSEGQLQDEIDKNSWIVFPEATEQLVFNTRKENMWKAILNEMGGRYALYANYPADPRLN